MHIACDNDDCVNKGAPYTHEAGDEIPACLVCGTPMVEIAEPAPPEPIPVVDEAQLTPDELELFRARARLDYEIRQALAATDLWAQREVEDQLEGRPAGHSLTPARRAYRQQLRALLGEATTTTTPQDIEIPAPPRPVS